MAELIFKDTRDVLTQHFTILEPQSVSFHVARKRRELWNVRLGCFQKVHVHSKNGIFSPISNLDSDFKYIVRVGAAAAFSVFILKIGLVLTKIVSCSSTSRPAFSQFRILTISRSANFMYLVISYKVVKGSVGFFFFLLPCLISYYNSKPRQEASAKKVCSKAPCVCVC